jgi:hypothetical protein
MRAVCLAVLGLAAGAPSAAAAVRAACADQKSHGCAIAIAHAMVGAARDCVEDADGAEDAFGTCIRSYCGDMCATKRGVDPACGNFCLDKAMHLFPKLVASYHPKKDKPLSQMSKAEVQARAKETAGEVSSAMGDLEEAEAAEEKLAGKLRAEAAAAPDSEDGRRKRASADKMSSALKEINQHLGKIQKTIGLAKAMSGAPGFLQKGKKPHKK